MGAQEVLVAAGDGVASGVEILGDPADLLHPHGPGKHGIECLAQGLGVPSIRYDHGGHLSQRMDSPVGAP